MWKDEEDEEGQEVKVGGTPREIAMADNPQRHVITRQHQPDDLNSLCICFPAHLTSGAGGEVEQH